MSNKPLIEDQNNLKYIENDIIANLKSDYIDESCCCFNIAYFPLGQFTIFEHWRISLNFPIFLFFTILFISITFFYDTLELFPNLKIKFFCYIYLSITLFFSILSYILVIAIGPGYLPYNWCINKKLNYSFEEMMSSIAIYQQQVDFGRTSERPPRSSFSLDARRFVLRADHFCLWTKSWIGLKNHRYFLLLTFWFSLFSLGYIIFKIYWFKYIFNLIKYSHKFDYKIIPGLISILFIIFLGLFCFYHFIISIKNVFKNLTLIEKWNKRNSPFPNYTCCKNFEEICGTKKLFFLWIFPCFCLNPLENGLYNKDENISIYNEIKTSSLNSV